MFGLKYLDLVAQCPQKQSDVSVKSNHFPEYYCSRKYTDVSIENNCVSLHNPGRKCSNVSMALPQQETQTCCDCNNCFWRHNPGRKHNVSAKKQPPFVALSQQKNSDGLLKHITVWLLKSL